MTLTQWQLGSAGLSGSGIKQFVIGVDTEHGINRALGANNSATLQFNITGATLAQINVQNWAIHGQGGPPGCSTKLVSTNGTVNAGPYDAACAAPTVTPEPATLALLATGLIGMGVPGCIAADAAPNVFTTSCTGPPSTGGLFVSSCCHAREGHLRLVLGATCDEQDGPVTLRLVGRASPNW